MALWLPDTEYSYLYRCQDIHASRIKLRTHKPPKLTCKNELGSLSNTIAVCNLNHPPYPHLTHNPPQLTCKNEVGSLSFNTSTQKYNSPVVFCRWLVQLAACSFSILVFLSRSWLTSSSSSCFRLVRVSIRESHCEMTSASNSMQFSWNTRTRNPVIIQAECLKIEPHHEKTCLQGFRPGTTQTGLLSYRD